MAQVRERKLQTVEYNSNNTKRVDLSRGTVYRFLRLHLSGQLTVTNVNNVYANVLPGDEWACVKRVRLIANGADVLWDITGNMLWMMNKFLYNVSPRVSPLLGAGAANPSFKSTLYIPFMQPKSRVPIDTLLDTRILSDLKLEIQWGTHTDIIGSATGFTVSPQIDVSVNETFATGNQIYSTIRTFPIEKEVTATNSKLQIPLPINFLYRSFLINTTDAAVDANDILNNFKLVSGSTVFADIDNDVLQHEQLLFHGVQETFSGTAYDDIRTGDGNNTDGWYYYDHVKDGMLSEAIDTLGFSEFNIEADVTIGSGTTKLLIQPLQISPVRKSA